MNILEIIETETGQKVTNETPLDALNVDSLEFLELLIALGIPSDDITSFRTVGDLARARG